MKPQSQPQLQLPSAKYKDSFLAAIKEYQAEDLPNYRNLPLEEMKADFEGYVEKIRSEANGKNLPAGYVPHTVFWLVDGDKYLGRLDIRHELTQYLETAGGHIGYDIRSSERRKGYGKLILELGLEKARQLGLKEIVITCDLDNVGSRKIIEANGGQYIDQTVDDAGVGKKRFKIKI